MSQDGSVLKRTPLYDYYQTQGLKLADFHGWALPIQFSKIQTEHEAVRQNVGLFETSHMGEVFVSGPDAELFINHIITNDIRKVDNNQAQYTAIVDESGGTLDDLIIYKLNSERFLFTPNASNTEKIVEWLEKHQLDYQVTIEDVSHKMGLVAVQGPRAVDVMQKLVKEDLSVLKPFHFIEKVIVSSIPDVFLSRTGYTGEDGFELYCQWDQTEALWLELLKAGEDFAITECGLGSRDTLRLEAGMSLYGQELDENINPLEAGISFAVKLNKDPHFIGQDSLQALKETGTQRISRGFEMLGKGIARQGYPVYNDKDEEIGIVTSGTQSPSLKKAIGFMLLNKHEAALGQEVYVQVRKKRIPAIITKKDWLKRK